MIETIIVDDDQNSIDSLTKLLDFHPDITIINTFNTGKDFIDYIKNNSFVLVFLDISLESYDDGLNVAHYLKTNYPNVHVIFATGSVTHAISCYETYPVDYLVKPIHMLRLNKALDEVRKKINQTVPQHQLDEESRIAIRINCAIKLIKVSEIVYIEKLGKKTRIHLSRDNMIIDSYESLNSLENLLKQYGLFRTHQSYLVSLKKIEEIRKSTYMNSYSIKVFRKKDEIRLSKDKYYVLKEVLTQMNIGIIG